jgi:hypothetical protein
MPLADALRFEAHVTAAADASADDATARGVLDPRTHGQRQCDVATDLLREAMDRHVAAVSDPAAADSIERPLPARQGRTHRPASSVQVHVRIDAATLLRVDDKPAWVDGVGPVPADVARDLAGTAGAQWRAFTVAPGTRHVVDVAADTYRPGAALRRFVTARDQTCTAPGCPVPAVDCDLDHVVPFPAGPTTAQNLRAVCRSHHRFKTQYVFEDRRRRQVRGPVPDDPPPF